MPDSIPVTVERLRSLLEHSKRVGTLDRWADLAMQWVERAESSLHGRAPQPIPMLLRCPACNVPHVDEPKGAWRNPPHRSHVCQSCGWQWRPADVPTVGVRQIATRGEADNSYTKLQREDT